MTSMSTSVVITSQWVSETLMKSDLNMSADMCGVIGSFFCQPVEITYTVSEPLISDDWKCSVCSRYSARSATNVVIMCAPKQLYGRSFHGYACRLCPVDDSVRICLKAGVVGQIFSSGGRGVYRWPVMFSSAIVAPIVIVNFLVMIEKPNLVIFGCNTVMVPVRDKFSIGKDDWEECTNPPARRTLVRAAIDLVLKKDMSEIVPAKTIFLSKEEEDGLSKIVVSPDIDLEVVGGTPQNS